MAYPRRQHDVRPDDLAPTGRSRSRDRNLVESPRRRRGDLHCSPPHARWTRGNRAGGCGNEPCGHHVHEPLGDLRLHATPRGRRACRVVARSDESPRGMGRRAAHIAHRFPLAVDCIRGAPSLPDHHDAPRQNNERRWKEQRRAGKGSSLYRHRGRDRPCRGTRIRPSRNRKRNDHGPFARPLPRTRHPPGHRDKPVRHGPVLGIRRGHALLPGEASTSSSRFPSSSEPSLEHSSVPSSASGSRDAACGSCSAFSSSTPP